MIQQLATLETQSDFIFLKLSLLPILKQIVANATLIALHIAAGNLKLLCN